MTAGPRPPADRFAPAVLRAAYTSGSISPGEVIDEVYRRIGERGDDGVWISLVPHEEARRAAEHLDPARVGDLPLFGVPFSVKDNIDVAGMDTTAACPDFAYPASSTAFAVRLLEEAGAILVGKTNLDQFATGLSGARSPYGVPSSVGHAALISGGSSSGAALSVAAGLVGFAIGTDTAGSGRVPAALNGVVGMKPSIGLVSTDGVLPACASLDCVSVFAPSVADGAAVLTVLSRYDDADPGSRQLAIPPAVPVPVDAHGLRLGVPMEVAHWGSRGEQEAWDRVLRLLADAGVVLVPFDPEPFLEAGRLLYGGPWVAERLAGLSGFVSSSPGSLHPVTYDVITAGASVSGVDTFLGAARLRSLRRLSERVLADVDALLTPTVTSTYTIAEMAADPIRLNTALGTWTTFTNLLDLCGVAVPAGGDPVPFGVTVQAEAGRDSLVAGIAELVSAVLDVRPLRTPAATPAAPEVTVDLAVVGAHLRGMPLHHQLTAIDAAFVRATRTSPEYRLFALPDGPPARPGLCRVPEGGTAIEVEVYRVPVESLGGFLAGVPAPLGLGTVRLEDGSEVLGFICEPIGFVGARDISRYGGWRSFIEETA